MANTAGATHAMTYSVRGDMTRTLSTLIVVCLVAATSVRPVLAERDQRSMLSAPHELAKLHARPSIHVAPRRVTSQDRDRELQAIVVECSLLFTPPAVARAGQVIGHPSAGLAAISTRSARGPPVV